MDIRYNDIEEKFEFLILRAAGFMGLYWNKYTKTLDITI